MSGGPAPAPILTVRVPVAIGWTQHAPGGCRCLCRIYHPGVGTGACIAAAEPGLLITLEPAAAEHRVPGIEGPLPVCAGCYRLLAVPDTPIAVLRADLENSLARRGTRAEAAAVALLADTGHLVRDPAQERVLDLALNLAAGAPIDLGEALARIDADHRRAVADAASIALGLTDTTAHPTPLDPRDSR